MAIGTATFRVRFSEFSDETILPDAKLQLYLDDAANIYMGLDESRWCGKYDYAQAYLTAHLLTVANGTSFGDSSSKAGVVSASSAGGVSVTKSVTPKARSNQDDFLASTSYGQIYLSVRSLCFSGVAVANCL